MTVTGSTQAWLGERFEADRPHLERVARRLLGSTAEAEDAVQEAWLRASRAGADGVQNLTGWLTTIVGRVALDMLRSRAARRETALPDEAARLQIEIDPSADPSHDALVAAEIGPALLVVLETLAPAERVAFVLHDLFAVPFEEIAPIVGRAPAAARQLASRGRRRVRGAPLPERPDLAAQRPVVEAFLAASRAGNLDALVAVLAPDVVRRVDVGPGAAPQEDRGAVRIASQAIQFSHLARYSRPALVDGALGLVAAPPGQPATVLRFTIAGGRVTEFVVISRRDRIAALDLTLLDW